MLLEFGSEKTGLAGFFPVGPENPAGIRNFQTVRFAMGGVNRLIIYQIILYSPWPCERHHFFPEGLEESGL